MWLHSRKNSTKPGIIADEIIKRSHLDKKEKKKPFLNVFEVKTVNYATGSVPCMLDGASTLVLDVLKAVITDV